MKLTPEMTAIHATRFLIWLGVHAFVVSMLIDVATLACLFALAIHALRLSRRIRQLAQDARTNAAIVHTLARQGERDGGTLARLGSEKPLAGDLSQRPQMVDVRAKPESLSAARVRTELEHLRAELSSAREP